MYIYVCKKGHLHFYYVPFDSKYKQDWKPCFRLKDNENTEKADFLWFWQYSMTILAIPSNNFENLRWQFWQSLIAILKVVDNNFDHSDCIDYCR